MSWKHLGESFDARVGSMAERATRRMTRRDALRAGVVGGAAGIAALTLGQSPALASASIPYSPGCGPTVRCGGCPANGCPGGYTLCKITSLCGTPPSFGGSGGGVSNNQGKWCEWPAGEWIAYQHLGHGYGYQACMDCVRTPINEANCDGWCTCLTTCICCQCLTAADVRAEMKRIGQLAAH